MHDSNHRQRFQTTRWTIVDALDGEDTQQREAALDELVRCYWPAVYGFLVRRGVPHDRAADVTQGFFTQVLSKGLFQRGDRDRGRLRNLILRSLKNFQINEYRRPANRAMLSLDADDVAREQAFLTRTKKESADATFDRRWAVAAMESAMRRCEAHYLDQGLERNWLAFEAQSVIPAQSGAKAPSLAELAERFGFDSAGRVANATQSVRRRLRVMLQEVVAETVGDATEAESEFTFLAELLD